MNAESAAELSREELIALVAALRAHIAELERRIGLNSSNSGKPRSSDGLKKPARVSSLRERSGKKPGGQKGHKGETLRQVTDPNEVINHYPPACSMCGVGLDPKTSVGHSDPNCLAWEVSMRMLGLVLLLLASSGANAEELSAGQLYAFCTSTDV